MASICRTIACLKITGPEHHISCPRYRVEPITNAGWTPVVKEADLKQPEGYYWTTFTQNQPEGTVTYVALELIDSTNPSFANNVVAFQKLKPPAPWRGE